MTTKLFEINKLLVANRGEIAIRVLRAASELRIRTVAVYTYEDRYSLHRYKSDEAYQIGKDDDPLKPYLDIEEIIKLAKHKGVDAIHPGYGFLSENVKLARRCREEGIIFVGPEPEVMNALGDKVRAKDIAIKANVPIIEDSKIDLVDTETALQEAERIGYPIMVKAAAGGGGRGMRVVQNKDQLKTAFADSKSEAGNAFGDDTIFLEKYIDHPKHIEVQIMGDNYGNIVHLFERDCSVQRRFQKVVEVAPSANLSQETRDKLYEYALAITREVNYNNVGTVEFLVDKEENIYFIEVNPRIQVEHTITEEITGVDIVRSQILIAKGHALDDPRIYIQSQEDVQCNGFAIQCRITTEDPENGFKPDYGTIIAYRNAGGFGIRIDEGSSYAGVNISPFFDSMLVKVSSHGRTLKGAAQRLHRALREFRIRGVKTNIGFLENVISHPTFYNGECTVKFIDEHPDLFKITQKFDRGTKTLRFLADVSVNGHPDVKFKEENKTFRHPVVPDYDKYGTYPKGTKNILTELGPEKFAEWLRKEKAIHYTDTTFRDAHQSLLATRMRGIDMMKVAEGYAKNNPEIFSMEVWGGATFDVCMRFLHENPWERLAKFRRAMPNVLLQMLLRGSNAVGYKAYPDNLIEKFIEKSAETGIDIFRIFDSLNWLEAMKVSIKTVRERTNSIAEAAICYTGDILDPEQKKYTLDYYIDFAKQLEGEGAHIIAIKDMAGLLKPYAAKELISALKSEINLPIHLHTHDTSSVQSATYLQAIEAGVDVVDVALGSMSGLTSQPNFNSVASYMQGHEREQKLNINSLNDYSTYWEYVREYYYPFESGLKAGTAEIYDNEIPGGQYSNLRPQANALGLGNKFETVKKNYALVNLMFGDLVKVTPSSKVVGDMALYMTSNNLTPDDIFEKGHTLSFPDSVVDLFRGELGQPVGGFPEKLSKIILKGEKPFTDKPNKHLEPIDFNKEMEAFKKKFDGHDDEADLLAYLLYPKVYEEFYNHQQKYGEVGYIPTLAFFYGMKNGEEILVEISEGKTIIIKLLYISEPNEEALRTVSFELNGQTRRVQIKDNSAKVDKVTNKKISGENEVGAPLQGKLASIKVKRGDKVTENTALFVIEAMKMESSITAPRAGVVKEVHLKSGDMVQQDDLVVSLE
ncbi:pyruvate carboxylase [Marivirga tractuosa]|uniref:Pyruvate carboxylase n=1 Tax=Marivirga tractuosa (strain ATCC 23168 / DSM 4126 / NBRC 15989 / NCIMB 1408 / VKM B-1430 / H-43) TaxID=643867 RepID=E4TU73_MARTH|nr:pyruvate carboxylase [Marivirga tractuosa]ADR21001.1 pyruvate carboxylase [Marivirga tractuosa DSM 4126]BDD14544.1 pyruvate carboxylase [Marivirga tractuosa]